jgi:hypothetical protein
MIEKSWFEYACRNPMTLVPTICVVLRSVLVRILTRRL